MTGGGGNMTKELTGKVAIVTGAGRNIGRAIALALADAGASIVVNARNNRTEAEAVAGEIKSRGGMAIVHIGDVADTGAVQSMAERPQASSAGSISSSTTRHCAGEAVCRHGLSNGGKSPRRHPRWRVSLHQGVPAAYGGAALARSSTSAD
jgi:NAD(P)-dependent dehydrogenase (short-subunit alcohol dehydrogenase family)